jgi:hypothetical protein
LGATQSQLSHVGFHQRVNYLLIFFWIVFIVNIL